MNKQEATRFIQEVFQSPFDERRFSRFAAELLNHIEPKPFSYSGALIKDAYKQHVQHYKRIGTYTDPNGDEVDILIVHLKRGTTLERARTMQRNFIAHYLRDRGDRDAALVAYYSDDEPDWRFSLVRMAYKRVQDEASGKMKVVEELTPARRYSFLVGETEPSHTAQQQFVALLSEERHDPTLDALEDAFNLETVTKEFFERYKALFLRVREALDGLVQSAHPLRAEFQTKGIDTAHFAKKLLGQIVFLYFLQKKGWLGVAPGAEWGSGPKDFLRRLFSNEWGAYTNFFNERLEPLFYEALALRRPDNLYPLLGCQIPFLNGGLFEPVGGYDWQRVDVLLDNAIFATIFDTFDLYNFTVRENEPLEKEVAVDPEMLGKVFENLLEVTDRKSKGAFYTPREIVQYMCQESLINYLDTALNLGEVAVGGAAPAQGSLFADPTPRQRPLTTWERREVVTREALALFIRKGELVKELDEAKESGTKTYDYKLPEAIRRHAHALDDALATIKICDPAIGSGAFPVGMMQEIVRAREVLTSYLGDSAERSRTFAKSPTSGYTTNRTAYAFKRHAIQESIYGVDIDPGAVDIAKLRLWLSLVVDEEDYRTIKPLPNLDYKIVCGNSLLRVEKTLFNHDLLHTLQERKAAYFAETDREHKSEQRAEIDAMLAQVSGGGIFDFEVYFSEVFDQQGGFDVVIGNPPYVRQELLKAQKPHLKAAFPKVFTGTADLFVYFYAKGIDLLRRHGTLALITSNKFMRAGYGEKLRSYLTNAVTLRTVIDFGDLPVFDATAYPCIVIVEKIVPSEEQNFQALNVTDMTVLASLPQEIDKMAWRLPQKKLAGKEWSLISEDISLLIQKLHVGSTSLGEYIEDEFYRGVVTGFNEAFVLTQEQRDALVAADAKSAEIIKPWLRGRDVKRWKISSSNLYLIFTRRGIDIDDYPAVKKHLVQFETKLRPKPEGWPENQEWPGRKPGKYQWYEIQDSTAYYAEFDKYKIISTDIAKRCEFTLDMSQGYIDATLFCIPRSDRYLLALLNSSLVEAYYRTVSSSIRGDYLRFKKLYLYKIPIKVIPDDVKKYLSELVDEILAVASCTHNDYSQCEDIRINELEQIINQEIYRLYGLTSAEIALVEAQVR